MKTRGLACGLSRCPLCPVPYIDNVPEEKIEKLPTMKFTHETRQALKGVRSMKKPVIRERQTHSVKAWSESYNRITRRQGDFDIRFSGDRDYQRGDILRICEWNPETKMFTGRVGICNIQDIMRNHEGLEPEYVVLGLFFIGAEQGTVKESEEWP